MKILMTGPDNDASRSLGGIVTVVNMILNNNGLHEIRYFNRDMGERNKARTFFKKISLFRRLLRTEAFNLVHFHFSFDTKSLLREALYILAARRKKQPIIIHFHGGILLFQKRQKRLARWILSSADCIIVLSEIEKRSLTSLYKVPAYKVLVLRNCIDLKEIPVMADSRHYNKRLIFFGRFHESKGIQDIADACRILKDEDFRFDAYGSGPGQQWFTSSMTGILESRFSYRGLVWGEKKWQALNDSDIFLLPSRYGEGLPMALLEAMALGKVVIASDDASISDVVTDKENGLLVKKSSPVELAEKIRSIWNNEGEQKRIGANAKLTIQNDYSSGYYMKSLHSIYYTLTN